MSDTIKLNLKFCSRFLLKGKKTKAEKILKRLLNSLSSKRYHPHKTLYLALLNLRPLIELRQIKKRRKKFLVPFPLKKNRRLFLALNFFFNFSLSDKRSRTEEIVKKCSKDLCFLPIGDIVLKGKTVPVPLYNPVSKEFFNSTYSRRYQKIYKELQKTNTEVRPQNDSKGKFPDHPVGKEMVKLSDEFPDEPLAKFHTDRIKKGLFTTKVVMDSK